MRLGERCHPSVDVAPPERDVGAALVLVRIRHVIADELHDRVRAERLGERGATARAEDTCELARSRDGIQVVQDGLAEGDVERRRRRRGAVRRPRPGR